MNPTKVKLRCCEDLGKPSYYVLFNSNIWNVQHSLKGL